MAAGWEDAKRNLEETFIVLENLYNITDMETGVHQVVSRSKLVMMQNFPDGRNAVHAGHAHIRKHGVVSPLLD